MAVELKVTLSADGDVLTRVAAKDGRFKPRKGRLQAVISSDEPKKVMEEVREMVETMRRAENPKRV